MSSSHVSPPPSGLGSFVASAFSQMVVAKKAEGLGNTVELDLR